MSINQEENAGQAVAAGADIGTQRRRIAVSGLVGTTIEYYDFLIYGLIAPTIFSTLFFPSSVPVVTTIAALGTFAVGYASRPLGGIVFGHYGDRIGRKKMLYLTMLLMGGATTVIGVLPTYAAIGVAASILLISMRFLQGFALGGETAGAVILAAESAQEGKRGGYAALIQIGAALGSVFASLAAAAVARMPEEPMMSWGWRIPFVASAVLVVVGLYVRARVAESPVFTKAISENTVQKMPLLAAFKEDTKACLTIFFIMITETSMLQIFTVYTLVYGVEELQLDQGLLLQGILIGNIVGIAANPLFGRISDYVGRRPMVLGSLAIAAAYVAFVYFPMLGSGNAALIVLATAIPPAVIQTMIFGVEASFYPEQFSSARTRFSGLGFSRALGGVVGGLFPLIAVSLYAATGTIASVIGYYVAISAISFTATLLARETRRSTLR